MAGEIAETEVQQATFRALANRQAPESAAQNQTSQLRLL